MLREAMPRVTRLFRVFISSTFSDFTAEREVMRDRVFPRVRALCRARAVPHFKLLICAGER